MAIGLTKLYSRQPGQLPDAQSTANHDSDIPKKICAVCSYGMKGRAQSNAEAALCWMTSPVV
jgi:hypothetical protein